MRTVQCSHYNHKYRISIHNLRVMMLSESMQPTGQYLRGENSQALWTLCCLSLMNQCNMSLQTACIRVRSSAARLHAVVDFNCIVQRVRQSNMTA